jgi:hypothetical protein
MRSFVTLGVLSLLGAAALVACGDDDPGPGAGGSAGTSNNAGAGGRAGAGGIAGSGTGGTPIAGGGGMGGAPVLTGTATCTGCVELVVPVNGGNSAENMADQVGYQIAFTPPPGVDMSNAVITWRLQAVENNDNFFLNLYAQMGAPGYAGQYEPYTALTAAAMPAGTFRDIVLDLSTIAPLGGAPAGDAGPAVDAGDAGGGGAPRAPQNAAFNKAQIESIGIQLGTSAAFTGTGVVRVAVDSITIAGVPGQADRTFTAGAEGLAINMYQVPPGTLAPIVH